MRKRMKSGDLSISLKIARAFLLLGGSVLLLLLLLFSCNSREKSRQFSAEEKQRWEREIRQGNLPVDSLQSLLAINVSKGNHLVVSIVCSELGSRMRVASDFL